MTGLLSPLGFKRGPQMKNRFMLAPLTNQQSHVDGVLSEDEFTWLTKRAEGGFGLTMTCAAHVQAIGQGFPRQLGIFGDQHLDGLARLASTIKQHDSIAICQLHHAGMRSPADLVVEAPVCPSADEKTGARALTLEEVHALRDDFVAAAVRSERAGFDGVELHGAHGYIICQFLSVETNHREDEYGGSEENRNRFLLEMIDGIRAACGKDFMLGVRLSPERFGLKLQETIALAAQLMRDGKIDFLDMSLWDSFKESEEEAFKGRPLLSYFTELDRGDVRLGVAGKIRTPEEAEAVFGAGIDWIMLGRAAILHHNFPSLYASDQQFEPVTTPVTRQHLAAEGLSENFIAYMSNWPGFVADETAG